MGRPLRVQYPGAWYHITSRGNERKAIFKSNGDREKFLTYLASSHERYDAVIHAYTLMSNHYQMRGSAVSQSNRRFKIKLNHDKKLKALLERSIEKLKTP